MCIFTAAVAAYIFRFCQLGAREGRLPPSGWWSLGAYRARVGDSVQRFAAAGRVLAVVIGLAGVGLGLAVENLIDVLLKAAIDD
jgi:hypothetical protein